MHIELRFPAAAVVLGLVAFVAPGSIQAQDELRRRLLKASEAEQSAWINSDLDAGMQAESGGGVLTMLILNKSEVTLPLIERKIEEVLRSASPLECFTDKSVDPQKFVDLAAAMIVYAGDEQALKEASKLMKIDEKRFGWMVGRILQQAGAYRNPFSVAYRGFEIGDPAVDSRIAPWFESRLDRAEALVRQPGVGATDFEVRRLRQWWGEAVVEKYGGVPTESQWTADPLAQRLTAPRAEVLHDDVMRAAREAVQKRSQRK